MAEFNGVHPQTAIVIDALIDAIACIRPLVFTGPGVHDVLVDFEGVPCRLDTLIAGLMERRAEKGLVLYSPAKGATVLVDHPRGATVPPLPRPDDEADEVVRRLCCATSRGFAVVIDRVDDLLGVSANGPSTHPNDRVARELFEGHGLDADFDSRPAPMIGIDRSGDLSAAFTARHGRPLVRTIALPDRATLEAVAALLQQRAATSPTTFAQWGSDPTSIASAARGLRSEDLVDVSRRCAARNRLIDQAEVLRLKAEELPRRSGGVLRLHDTSTVPDVSDMAHVSRLIAALQGSVHWPLGICLAGPPGTGKSLTSLVIAAGLGLPLVSLNLVMNSLVGESERRIQAALETAEALAPVVVWIDEIDRMYLGQRSEGGSADGGTSERVQAALFSFIDPRHAGNILFCGTSNRVDLLDGATRDRFKTVVPLLLPTFSERASLLAVMARRAGVPLEDESSARSVAARPELATVTARDLHDLVAKACRLAGRSSWMTTDHLHAALDRSIPRDEGATSELMTLHALRLCADLDLLPWRAGEPLGEPESYPPFVFDLLDSHSRPQRAAIDERLRAYAAGRR